MKDFKEDVLIPMNTKKASFFIKYLFFKTQSIQLKRKVEDLQDTLIKQEEHYLEIIDLKEKEYNDLIKKTKVEYPLVFKITKLKKVVNTLHKRLREHNKEKIKLKNTIDSLIFQLSNFKK